MDDLIENALRIMVSLARLPTLEPTTVAELLGVRLHALRASTYRVASAAELAAWDPGRMDVYRAPGGSLRLAFERHGDTDASGFSIDGLERP